MRETKGMPSRSIPRNVPVPQAPRMEQVTARRVQSRVIDAPPPSSRPSDGFLASMIPSRPESMSTEEAEQTRVGATVVGAQAFIPKLEPSNKKAYLTIIAGHRAGEMFELDDDDESIIGRGAQSAIHLDSDGVSRKHARIVRQGDGYVLQDLGSTNGTWVDNKRISFHTLVDGDRVQIGTEIIARFNFHDELEAGMQQQLYDSAVRDPLTRAYNRKHFHERLAAELAHAARHRTHLSLVMLDIDHFKRVNDTHGHPAGDAVLRAIAGAVMKVVRVEDVFARVGGEEFALLARGVDGPSATAFADRLRRGVERLPVIHEGTELHVTASFGVAAVSELPSSDATALIKLSDERLYAAKNGGRNRVVGVG
ncbi:MAG: diguanylate cyclase [Polyangiales bacterium]